MYIGHLHTQIWYKPSLQPIYISIGVKGTNLDGTKFKRYLTIYKAYPQKDVGSVEKLIIYLTMSNKF